MQTVQRIEQICFMTAAINLKRVDNYFLYTSKSGRLGQYRLSSPEVRNAVTFSEFLGINYSFNPEKLILL